MKYLATALLVCVVLAPAALCSVEVMEVHPSSQKPLITVLKDGVQKEGTMLSVFTKGGKQKVTLITDSHGMAKLPHLARGTYCIAAATSPTLRADLCLRIGANYQRNPSTFTMELVVKPPPPPTFAQRLAAAEAGPASATNQRFSGTVVDPSGATIPRVSIGIYPQGAGASAHPRKIRSDRMGRFSRNLSPGRYTAVFSAQGFENQFLTFEVLPGAAERDLRVKLKLGAVS